MIYFTLEAINYTDGPKGLPEELPKVLVLTSCYI